PRVQHARDQERGPPDAGRISARPPRSRLRPGVGGERRGTPVRTARAELPGGAAADVRGRPAALQLLVGRAEERVHRPDDRELSPHEGDYARWLDAAEGRSDANPELVRAFHG